MKKDVFFVLTIILIIFISISFLYAIPSQINFQGRLIDNGGQPITGIVTLTFSIYNSSTTGTLLWQETHNNQVISNGVLNIVLGTIVSFSSSTFSGGDKWIEIAVGNDTLLPRQKFSSVPYAILADNSYKLNNFTYEQYLVPRGVIVMWSGTISSIPSGWALCDGTNGTPDLRDKFVYGVSVGQNPGTIGGEISHSHIVSSHTHTVNPPETATSKCASDELRWMSDQTGGSSWAAQHDHTVDIPSFSSGSSSPGTNSISHLPPYYKIAFIMKL